MAEVRVAEPEIEKTEETKGDFLKGAIPQIKEALRKERLGSAIMTGVLAGASVNERQKDERKIVQIGVDPKWHQFFELQDPRETATTDQRERLKENHRRIEIIRKILGDLWQQSAGKKTEIEFVEDADARVNPESFVTPRKSFETNLQRPEKPKPTRAPTPSEIKKRKMEKEGVPDYYLK